MKNIRQNRLHLMGYKLYSYPILMLSELSHKRDNRKNCTVAIFHIVCLFVHFSCSSFSSFWLALVHNIFCKFVDFMPCELSTFILNCILPVALYIIWTFTVSSYRRRALRHHEFNCWHLQHQPYDATANIFKRTDTENGKIIERSYTTEMSICDNIFSTHTHTRAHRTRTYTRTSATRII